MNGEDRDNDGAEALARAAEYGRKFRAGRHPLHPDAGADELRAAFDIGLPDRGRAGADVIDDLIAAAEPGLVGNIDPRFFAWVMGGSHPVGVAADWLTAIWGQNAGIYQTAPAAAIAEEVAGRWLLELLELPVECSVGFTTGATMAAFICLAAARGEVLRRRGCDFGRDGLQGAPEIKVFVSDATHASNLAALGYLGMGERNVVPIATDDQGIVDAGALGRALAAHEGPAIVICQAGQINTGAFDRFDEIADLSADRGAWLHVDGAFGLWARATAGLKELAAGAERADSWAVDGHKWIQVPYDSGYAIVRDSAAHRRAMDITASYLSEAPGDGRNPTHYNPELSRRARGFATWAMLQALGRAGIAEMIERHCRCARLIAERLAAVEGITVLNRVEINQVILTFARFEGDGEADALTERVAASINESGGFFLRTADWKGRRVLRVSVIENETDEDTAASLAREIEQVWAGLRSK
ncbi:MAG: aminotransferase class V-fold PLP-dependent enzyme [Alphaproteobacteria bacterium]|nr:aminotransferase class V-fold PLP-dependent enzyme [Alphaproteobacteria bacterium]